MSIKVLDQSGLRFPDAHSIMRRTGGIALTKRANFRKVHASAIAQYSAHIDNGGELDDLWLDKHFASTLAQLLEMVHIKPEWLINGEINLSPRLILTYPQSGLEYQGDLIAFEFPSQSKSGKQIEPSTPELQAFSSLIIEDIHGELHELFPLPVSPYYRFFDLLKLMRSRLNSSFHLSYDSDRVFARAVHEALGLFDLEPEQVSASLACELLIADWIEPAPGHYQPIPGWLDQLCNPPESFESTGKPLPKEESPHHALIASLWGDGGLTGALNDANSMPYPVLRSILHSRNRMFDEAIKKNKKASQPSKYTPAEQKWLDSVDYDALLEELKKNPSPIYT